MKGRRIGVTTAYTIPRRKYSWRLGSVSGKSMLPGSIALSTSLSVFTRNMFFRWKITRGFNLRISPAIPAQPSTIIYVIKKVAFIGIDTPIFRGILHERKQNAIELQTSSKTNVLLSQKSAAFSYLLMSSKEALVYSLCRNNKKNIRLFYNFAPFKLNG